MEQKFNHAEAFNWMYYSNDDETVGYWIYNSRDGVTPFSTQIGDAQLQHRHWNKDLHAPNYKPKPGDLVWRTLTRQEAEDYARRTTAEYPEHFQGERAQAFIKHAGDDTERLNSPCLAKVDENGEYILQNNR